MVLTVALLFLTLIFLSVFFKANKLITLTIRGFTKSTTEESLTTIFSEFGVVRSMMLDENLIRVMPERDMKKKARKRY